MKKAILSRLQALDSEILAQALFDLAKQSEEAATVVDRLTRTSDEAYKSTKRAISSLKRSSSFIDWRAVDGFARKLENIVDDIAQIDITPEQRFDLICQFIETDDSTFERVDDSSGVVGELYRSTANALFGEYAAAIAETHQSHIVESLDRLLLSNNYGVRDGLLEEIVLILSESKNRELVVRFSTHSDKETDSYLSDEWLGHVMTIASHLGDTRLFEITALESVASHEEVPDYTKYSIASNYFKHGDLHNAKRWMDDIGVSNGVMQTRYSELLIALHDKLGNSIERDHIALEEFHRAPSVDALDTLVAVIGEQSRTAIVDEQVEKILGDSKFSEDGLEFLVDTGFLDFAANYTVQNRATINGDHYWQLPNYAAKFSKSGYPLATICIYRALLNSILRRGNTKSYYYGVRYLMKLDELSDIDLVQGMDDHSTYKKDIQTAHGRKRSFWSKYDSNTHYA